MIPKYNEMYNELLELLNQNDSLQYREIVDRMSDVLQLSVEDRNQTLDNGNSTVIYYRIGWTKTYLAKAGLVETVKRGVYQITEEGKKVVDSKVKVTNEYLMKYPSFVQFIRPDKNEYKEVESNENLDEDSTPKENIDKSIRLIQSRLSSELLDIIMSKSPLFFEKLVLNLLDRMGYAFDKNSIISTSYTGDEGIDGIIQEDRFGFNSIYVQAKRWQGTVGRPEIQKFLGAVAGQGGTKGLFITTSKFTKEAIQYANKQLQVKLVLVDGEKLTDLMIRYNLGVSVYQTYELKQIDMDYFEDE